MASANQEQPKYDGRNFTDEQVQEIVKVAMKVADAAREGCLLDVVMGADELTDLGDEILFGKRDKR